MDKMRMESVDMTAQNIEKIGALFPNCITEAADEDGNLKKAINFDLLKQILSDDVIEGSEAYELNWVGKKLSVVEANRPIRKTLRPCMEESLNWDVTENLYIEGDNLEVLKLLQESYLGTVKLIYIDPPYNTGNDILYKNDYSVSVDEYSEEISYDSDGNLLFVNTENNGRFHSDWCSMMYSRIILAKNYLIWV
jgi:adenine-specific DNA-methyltransferase